LKKSESIPGPPTRTEEALLPPWKKKGKRSRQPILLQNPAVRRERWKGQKRSGPRREHLREKEEGYTFYRGKGKSVVLGKPRERPVSTPASADRTGRTTYKGMERRDYLIVRGRESLAREAQARASRAKKGVNWETSPSLPSGGTVSRRSNTRASIHDNILS